MQDFWEHAPRLQGPALRVGLDDGSTSSAEGRTDR